MSLIDEKPAGLASGNALDQIPDDLLTTPPAQVRYGSKVIEVMDKPPEPGEFMKAEITFKCRDDGRTRLDDGTYVYYRKMDFVSAKVTVEPYVPKMDDASEDGRPSLFDAGDPAGDDEDGEDAEDLETAPGFSHAGAGVE